MPGRPGRSGSAASSRRSARATRALASTPTCSWSPTACSRPRLAEAAQSCATRFEPEVFVPPLPGRPRDARARARSATQALYFDRMDAAPAGRARARRRAGLRQPRVPRRHPRRAREHLAASRGVATKTTYATVPALRAVPLRGARRRRREHEGARLQRQGRGPALARPARTPAAADEEPRRLRPRSACRPAPFDSRRSVGAAHARATDAPCPTPARARRASPRYFWTIREFVRERLLRFLFAEARRRALSRSHDRGATGRVAARPRRATDDPDGAGDGPPRRPAASTSFDDLGELVDCIARARRRRRRAGPGAPIATGTVDAFLRRLAARRATSGT